MLKLLLVGNKKIMEGKCPLAARCSWQVSWKSVCWFRSY